MADGIPACRFIRHARGMSALTGGTPVLRFKLERAVFFFFLYGLAFEDFAFEDLGADVSYYLFLYRGF